jgi:hypothetical protein
LPADEAPEGVLPAPCARGGRASPIIMIPIAAIQLPAMRTARRGQSAPADSASVTALASAVTMKPARATPGANRCGAASAVMALPFW